MNEVIEIGYDIIEIKILKQIMNENFCFKLMVTMENLNLQFMYFTCYSYNVFCFYILNAT